ncbi:MAG: hypothetical protein NZ901_07970 [Geminocystis sp.]|nr:hypothetical protein [Geminocystis sp.]HIK37982.1 hypothetical protein [Geminocystis sp. M7585_C2015_104]MCS7148109.1 hypothetical protein [Geminocystis sp.]MCX8077854.1 hypothetical protein [Geminocystis sp.]MDW8116460.1 hypothetical protein [Geminocystis sp.]
MKHIKPGEYEKALPEHLSQALPPDSQLKYDHYINNSTLRQLSLSPTLPIASPTGQLSTTT